MNMMRGRRPTTHDPAERVVIGHVGEWQIRDFPRERLEDGFSRSPGIGHVQLWLPHAEVSVLTPSILTRGRWEAYPVNWARFSTSYFGLLNEFLRVELGVELPTGPEMHRVVRWFVQPSTR